MPPPAMRNLLCLYDVPLLNPLSEHDMPSLKLPALKICASIAVAAAVFSPVPGWCYTAVAYSVTVPDVAYVGQGPTAELAERYAIAKCDVGVRKSGEVPVCRITVKSYAPGWYAVACGQTGCFAALAFKTQRAAQDAAYVGCYKQQKFCYTEMTAWGRDNFTGAEESAKANK